MRPKRSDYAGLAAIGITSAGILLAGLSMLSVPAALITAGLAGMAATRSILRAWQR